MAPAATIAVALMTLSLGACAPGPQALNGSSHGVTANASIPPGADLSVPAPTGSGAGRRVVWSKRASHVWVVDANNRVVREYPVTDLDWKTPVGTYRVLRKSRRSYATDNGERVTLNYFVPFFRRCPSCSLIGFHAIPVTPSGRQIEPDSALGSEMYKSHGCIRQSAPNARFLYDFVTPGTKVVVVK